MTAPCLTKMRTVAEGEVAAAELHGVEHWTTDLDGVIADLTPREDEADDLDEDPLVAELEAICREFSKDRRIGPDDNLFEVGVSSLTLTEIVLAIDEKYPGKLDISDLFDYPTLRDIADFMRR